MVYRKKYPAARYPNVVLKDTKWDRRILLNPDSDLLAVDCMYYPGVEEAIIKHLTLNQARRAYIIL